jgi:hypothetical protein
VARSDFPYEHLRKSGWVGAKIRGAGVVEEFINAFYGLLPWDSRYDPEYFDKLLISPAKRPSRLIFKQGPAEAPPVVAPECVATKVDLHASPDVTHLHDATLGDLDRQTLQALQSRSDTDAVHRVLHYLYFSREPSARKVAAILRQRGFEVEDRLSADGVMWLVLAKSNLVPTEAGIAELKALFEQIAATNDGQYDGWEAKVRPRKQDGPLTP